MSRPEEFQEPTEEDKRLLDMEVDEADKGDTPAKKPDEQPQVPAKGPGRVVHQKTPYLHLQIITIISKVSFTLTLPGAKFLIQYSNAGRRRAN